MTTSGFAPKMYMTALKVGILHQKFFLVSLIIFVVLISIVTAQAYIQFLLFGLIPFIEETECSMPYFVKCSVNKTASITASATFGHSASPDNGTCWHIMALQGAMQVYVKYFGNFCHHNPLYSHHL